MRPLRERLAGLTPAVLHLLPLLLLLGAAPARGTDLPPAVDLRAEAEQARRQGGPLIVIYSRRDCKYCETVKRDYLQPLTANPRYRQQVLVRQINQDSAAPLTNFRGQPSSHARFAADEKIKLVPVVAFYGPHGRRLAEPIVGARLPDFYQGYLEAAIEQSIGALQAR